MAIDEEVMREFESRSALAKGEHERLREDVMQIKSDLRAIDNGGTRGMQAVHVTVQDLVGKMSELKSDFGHAQDVAKQEREKHEKEHIVEEETRRRNRRFIITSIIAGLAMLAATVIMMATLFDILLRHISVHG